MKKLSLILTLCLFCIMGQAGTVVSGEMAEMNSKWEYDTEAGVLTISLLDPESTNPYFIYEDGTVIGGIPDFEMDEETYETSSPWFMYSQDITSIVVEEGIVNIGTIAFAQCFYVENISLPVGLQKISRGAFTSCGMQSITIPEGVTEIGEYAFGECASLQTVTLPSTIEKVMNYCFAGCESLVSVTCYAVDVPTVYQYTFGGVDFSSAILYVPEESIEYYEADKYWGQFNVEAINEEETVQGLFDVRSDNAAAQKQMRNGMLLIEVDGKTYNAQGAEIK